ncbi:oligosaccharide flippase family protein [Conexibacter sp. DBS9H8]|uniref:oligosaccharide flippase family protein n=1 Tax=Conexibacter sp. DBS9H8 TaxID=2937801 RepID=UPI00200E3ADE|nr:oligosaccharide flippase family protein [Conexibacter sp. DBS9H8]
MGNRQLHRRRGLIFALMSRYLVVLVQVLGTLVSTPVILAAYGPAMLGRWALALAIMGYIQGIDLGLGIELARSVAASRSPEERSRTVGAALNVLVVPGLAAVAAGLGLGIALGSTSGRGPWLGIAIGCGGLLLPLSVGGGVLYGTDRQVSRNAFTVGATLIGLAATIAVAVAHGNLALLTLAGALGPLLAGVGTTVQAFLKTPGVRGHLRQDDLTEVRQLLGASIGVFALTASGQVIAYSDTFVVDALFGPAVLGVYVVAMRVIGGLTSLTNQLSDVLLPRFADPGAGPLEQQERIRLAITIAACIGFALISILIVFGHQLLNLWVGPHYQAAWGVALLLSGAVLLNGPARVAVVWAIAASRREGLTMLALFESFANVALSVLLGVAFGFRGVAAASMVTLVVTNGWILPTRLLPRGGLSWKRDFVRPVGQSALLVLPISFAAAALLGRASVGGWWVLPAGAGLGLGVGVGLLKWNLRSSRRLFAPT